MMRSTGKLSSNNNRLSQSRIQSKTLMYEEVVVEPIVFR